MVCGNRGFQRGENENLTLGADLEDRTAAVPDIEIVLFVESESCCDAHSFDVDRHVPVGRDLINDAVEPAGDVEHAVLIERDTGSVHDVVDERLQIEIEIQLVKRDGNLLAARPAERSEDISLSVDRRVRYRV